MVEVDSRFVRAPKPELELPEYLAKVYADVDDRVAPHDHMLNKRNFRHYYGVGASALAVIDTCSNMARMKRPSSILDFACGAGRVTRWMSAAFPEASMTCADVRDEDLEFHKTVFGHEIWKSSGAFGTLSAPRQYDLIWVGSLFTHISEKDAELLLSQLMSWLSLDGLLLVTFHGRRVVLGKTLRRAKYISDVKFGRVCHGYDDCGYGYQDYDNAVGVGFSLTKPNWYFDRVSMCNDYTVAGFFERAWDNHHDVIGIARTEVCPRI